MLLVEVSDTTLAFDLHTRLRHHPGYCNLLKVKGIGLILAAVFVAEIGDVKRFPTAAALCCWAGLTPRHYESDKTVHRGHISKVVLPDDVVQEYLGVEGFRRAQTRVAAPEREDDLFAGLRSPVSV